MSRRLIHLGCFVITVLAVVDIRAEPALNQEAQNVSTPDTRDQAGHCIRFLRDRDRLMLERSAALGPLLARRDALDDAVSLLGSIGPQPMRAGALEQEVQRLDEQITEIRSVLGGKLSEKWLGMTRSAIENRLDKLVETRAAKVLLADVHATPARQRESRIELLLQQRQAAAQRIDATAQVYDQRQDESRSAILKHQFGIQLAMHSFGRLGEMYGVSVQAVQLRVVPTEGRLHFNWTDHLGTVIASAVLQLKQDPPVLADAPRVLDRYPLVRQDERSIEFAAGYFVVAFQVRTEAFSGEARVIDVVDRLLDLDRLHRLTPRLGPRGLD